jgi:hypothetical protein
MHIHHPFLPWEYKDNRKRKEKKQNNAHDVRDAQMLIGAPRYSVGT